MSYVTLHTGNSFCSFIAYLKNKFVGALPQIVNPAKGRDLAQKFLKVIKKENYAFVFSAEMEEFNQALNLISNRKL
jgi:hypothetical protein